MTPLINYSPHPNISSPLFQRGFGCGPLLRPGAAPTDVHGAVLASLHVLPQARNSEGQTDFLGRPDACKPACHHHAQEPRECHAFSIN